GAWGYGGAFALAGSIGLASAVLAVFLRAPGRSEREDVGTATDAVAREAL
ncbi:MFS transporter, partial [Streptomyces sp900116325]